MLKVVGDNVEKLEVRNLMDIPAMARGFADDLEAGDYGEVERVIVVIDTPDGLRTLGWGESVSNYEAIGILEAGKIVTFNSQFDFE